MIIINYIIAAFAILAGIIGILTVKGIMKSSKKLEMIREKLGTSNGTTLYIVFYIILPILFAGYLIFQGINGIAFL